MVRPRTLDQHNWDAIGDPVEDGGGIPYGTAAYRDLARDWEEVSLARSPTRMLSTELAVLGLLR